MPLQKMIRKGAARERRMKDRKKEKGKRREPGWIFFCAVMISQRQHVCG